LNYISRRGREIISILASWLEDSKLPVAVSQVESNCTAVGASGVAGCALITIFAEASEIQSLKWLCSIKFPRNVEAPVENYISMREKI
jgi:hypothetical protein